MSIEFDWRAAGRCFHPEVITLSSGSFKSCAFPSYFGIIRHPKHGVMLYDTGYSEHFAQESATFPGKLYAWVTPHECSPDQTAQAQLLAQGTSPRDVRMIFISHFHADHVSGLKSFPNAELICFKSAFEDIAGRSPLRNLLQGVLPGLLPEGFPERARWVESSRKVLLPPHLATFGHGFDVLGDQSVLAVELPGHARGQMGLLFEDRSGREIFLIGDACWSSRAYEQYCLPSSITRLVLSNWKEYRDTLSRLHQLHRVYPKLTILPSHCSQAASRYFNA